jgi:hypothetical protein
MKFLLSTIFVSLCLIVASTASAQAPGAPVQPCATATLDIFEAPVGAPDAEHAGPLQLPCPVFGGYVVLLESSTVPTNILANWSDVVAFTTGGPAQPGVVTDHFYYISDSADPTTGAENGMTPADLAFAGLTAADILANPTTIYIPEGQNAAAPDVNVYVATGPAGQIVYRIHSDPPEPPTPAANSTWGQLKSHYR